MSANAPTALAPRTMPQNQMVTAEHAAAVRTALKNSLYPGASDASVDLVLAYCRAGNLDPLTKPVHIVPMKVSTGRKDDKGWDIKETRDVVMPGIGLYRTNASRTGTYAGCSEPEYGPTRTLTFKREQWQDSPSGKGRVKKSVDAELEYPEWCRVTVRKVLDIGDGKKQVGEFTAVEYWKENYAEKGDDGAPNAMWEKRPFAQLAKCAEAQALRKAFPEAVGSQPTAEEMEGKDLVDVTPAGTVSAGVQMPVAKSAAARAPIEHEPQSGGETPAAVAEQLAGEPGIHVAGSMKKVLLAKASSAGLNEEELLERFPRVDASNINEVLADLTKLAEQQ